MVKPRVAIIGAGVSGLAALKECLENGLDTTVFEARSDIGGQWNYEEHPKPIPSATSDQENAFTTNIYESVILNSCRDSTNFSDFPMPPDRYGEFFGHRLFKRYIDDYADHFGLRKAIRLNSPVLSCRVTESGQWLVTYQPFEGVTLTEVYDALFACSGRVSTPLITEFRGRERFKGEFIHSHVYRRPAPFDGKRVAVIGFGNSAADISCDIAPQAREMHLITRRGGWVVPRYVFGKPAEAFNTRMAETVLPKLVTEGFQTALLNLVMGELPKEIKPKHTVHQANVTVRGDLLENIKVGRITPHRADIDEITETGLKLSNGETVDVDSIICCTGYKRHFPYLTTILHPSGEAPPLYKHIVPTRIPNLFILGLFELPGPALPVIEAQARWSIAILTKRIQLPPPEEMDEWIRDYHEDLSANMVHSERHATGVIHYTPYCDDLLSRIDAAPTLRLLLSHAPSLTRNPLAWLRLVRGVYLGVTSPAQYRLFGQGAKKDLAVATLLRVSRGGKELSPEEKAALEDLRTAHGGSGGVAE